MNNSGNIIYYDNYLTIFSVNSFLRAKQSFNYAKVLYMVGELQYSRVKIYKAFPLISNSTAN